MITLDSSALFVLLDRRQPRHTEFRELLSEDAGSFKVPAGIMAEITYLIETRLGQRVLNAFLEDLDEGSFKVDCGETDLPRIRKLVQRYADLPLGYADAAVIACAERSGGRVMTLDKHFRVVEREKRINVLPEM